MTDFRNVLYAQRDQLIKAGFEPGRMVAEFTFPSAREWAWALYSALKGSAYEAQTGVHDYPMSEIDFAGMKVRLTSAERLKTEAPIFVIHAAPSVVPCGPYPAEETVSYYAITCRNTAFSPAQPGGYERCGSDF